MSRVMCVCSEDEAAVLRTVLEADAEKMDVVCRDSADCVVDEVMMERPDVLIYELRPGSDSDRAVLWLVRHVAPRLPVVLMGEEKPASMPAEGMVRRVHRAPPAEEVRDAVQEMLHARTGA